MTENAAERMLTLADELREVARQMIQQERVPNGDIPSTFSVTQVLSMLDNWCERTTHEQARRLWNILSALRGPDAATIQLKQQTTSLIRAASLPQAAMRLGMDVAMTAPDIDRLNTLVRIKAPEDEPRHFYNHISYAAAALLQEAGKDA